MAQTSGEESDLSQRDLAARAAWLSHVGGLTQDQIAAELGISRQRVQRLVARAASQGLIRVRIAHPIADCIELERKLRSKYNLEAVWISPSNGIGRDPLPGLTTFAAPVFERMFTETPRVVALGTGRTLRMAVDQMQRIDGAHHKLVSLLGNVSPDGSASFYEVILRMAEKISAPHFPMLAPVLASSDEELELYRSLPHVKATLKLAASADLAIVGIGQMGEDAPLFVDGFITQQELSELRDAGAVGEMCGQVFDSDGNFIDHSVNHRMVSRQVDLRSLKVLCVGGGETKQFALRAALKNNLIDQLIIDEETARAILSL